MDSEDMERKQVFLLETITLNNFCLDLKQGVLWKINGSFWILHIASEQGSRQKTRSKQASLVNKN